MVKKTFTFCFIGLFVLISTSFGALLLNDFVIMNHLLTEQSKYIQLLETEVERLQLEKSLEQYNFDLPFDDNDRYKPPVPGQDFIEDGPKVKQWEA